MSAPAYTFVQQSDASTQTNAPSLDAPSIVTTKGNLLVAITEGDDTYANALLRDSLNHAWIPLCAADDAAASHDKTSMFATIAKGGATVISVDSGGGSGLAVSVAEYASPGAAFVVSGVPFGTNIQQPNKGADSYVTPLLGCSGPVLIVAHSWVFSGGPLGAGVAPNAFIRRAPHWPNMAMPNSASFEDTSTTGDARATFTGDATNEYNRCNILAAAFSLAGPKYGNVVTKAMLAALSSVLPQKVFPSIAPDQTGAPYIVYTSITLRPENTLADGIPLEWETIQVDTYSLSLLEVHDLSRSVRDAMLGIAAPLRVLLTDQGDTYESDVKLHRVMQQFSVSNPRSNSP